MTVVIDASPLIFLAKLRRLELVEKLLGSAIRVASSVREETLAPGVDPGEAMVLEAFFARCTVEGVRRRQRFALAMSRPDNDTLSLAVQRRADILVCDDRIVRLMAEAEGIRSLGTLGILLRSMREGLLSSAETRQHVDALIRLHGFRIGIELYQSVIAQIDLHGNAKRR
jgi:predicted nucleic acid-binding protein